MVYLKQFYLWYLRMETIPMLKKKNHDKEIICKNHRANLLSSLSLIFYSETHGQLLNNEMLVLEGKHPRTSLCSEALDMMFSLPGMFWITFST